jgi:hypothetical protein
VIGGNTPVSIYASLGNFGTLNASNVSVTGTLSYANIAASSVSATTLSISGSAVVPAAALSTQAVQAGQTIGKNVIVNGGNEIAQVNGTTGLTGVTNGAYAVDNSMYYASSVAAINEAQSSVTPTDSFSALGSTYKLLISSTASHTVLAGDISAQSLPIEGLNFARFHWGGAYALPASLSFGVTCSISGTNTYSGSIQNYARNRSYPFTYSCTGGAAATRIMIQNIPGDTSGTWVGATNAGAAYVNFDLGSGSAYQATAGAWTGSGTGNFLAASGVSTKQINATSGATLAITDAQLEQSTFTTTFERKLYDQVLRECQRYLPNYSYVSGGNSYIGTGLIMTGGTIAYVYLPLSVTPRTAPTGLTLNNATYFSAQSNSGTAALLAGGSFVGGSVNGAMLILNIASGYTAGQMVLIQINNTAAQLFLTGAQI